ncbi:HET domain-containing protein [Fusarium keratoplasticum]|nr:HET domain-containing protein [Fusarium keratoplasticum]
MGKNDDTPTLRHVHEEQYREPDYFYHTYYEDEDEYEEDEEDEEDNKDKDEDEDEDEDESEGDVSPDTDELFIAGVPPRRWKDELPGLPAMAEAAEAGCQLCQFLRQAILRKGVSFEGPIQVLAGYIWGASRSYVEQRDDGLVAWRCEVRDGRGEGYLLSAMDFNVETRNGKRDSYVATHGWEAITHAVGRS